MNQKEEENQILLLLGFFWMINWSAGGVADYTSIDCKLGILIESPENPFLRKMELLESLDSDLESSESLESSEGIQRNPLRESLESSERILGILGILGRITLAVPCVLDVKRRKPLNFRNPWLKRESWESIGILGILWRNPGNPSGPKRKPFGTFRGNPWNPPNRGVSVFTVNSAKMDV